MKMRRGFTLKKRASEIGRGIVQGMLRFERGLIQSTDALWFILVAWWRASSFTVGKLWGKYRAYFTLPLTFLAAGHVLLGFVLPAGQNRVLGIPPQPWLGYLPYLHTTDSFGLQAWQRESEDFLAFKIYRQDKSVVTGEFPGKNVTPFLRLQRWRQSSFLVTAPQQQHAQQALVKHLALQLPRQPLRIELFSAHWRWERNTLLRIPTTPPVLEMYRQKVGHFDPLTQLWTPYTPRQKPAKRKR